MLSLVDDYSRNPSRRDFLRIGSLGMAGLTLPNLLAARSNAADNRIPVTGKSIIFLFQQGGPTQFETFDPKMNAPSGNRSVTGSTQTTIPGVRFGGTYTKLAKQAHRMAIVRSFQSGSSAHKIQPIVTSETLDANIGSLYSRIVGTTDSSSGMPTNTALFPNAVDPEGPGEFKNFGQFSSAGLLGPGYAPFVPGAGSAMQENLQLRIPRDRLDSRRDLLAGLDRIKRGVDSSGMLNGMDRFQEQAFNVILGNVADAFDLSKEDPQMVARYDTSHLVRSSLWNYKNNREHYNANASSLGKLLLLARRLCQAGCGFVTVNTSFVWDMHADVNNLPMDQGMDYVASPFEHAVSAFIDDLEDSGLSEDIMLVCTGEMGRTPKLNARGGRDHWGRLTPLMLYGGGVTDGQVIGQSTRDGGEPLTDPYTGSNLVATVMNNLFDVSPLRITRGVPNDVLTAITRADPIRGLF
jgi:hypothetical protein